MIINSLRLLNFKNYTESSFEFCPQLNCIAGANGIGKTNLLDAIHYLCLCRSRFQLTDKELMTHHSDFFRLDGRFSNDENQDLKIVVKFGKRKKKEFSNNGVPYPRLSDHVGLIPLVMITPDDTDLITEGSAQRLSYIDTTLCQTDHEYLLKLIAYNKTLEQRNACLKLFAEKEKIDFALLDIYDEKISNLSPYIFEKRTVFQKEIMPIFNDLYLKISDGKEYINIEYQSDIKEKNPKELLFQNRERDIFLGRTTKGIHKDDLVLQMNDKPFKRFASQGQLKSAVLALRLAQYEYLRADKKNNPILLLDDIFDKLDQTRVFNLLQLLSVHNFGQVFITDTHPDRVQAIVQALGIEYKRVLSDEW